MLFFAGCIMILLLCRSCSTNLKNEKCSFYLAYEYAYKPDDIESVEGIPPIYGFSVKGNEEEGKQLVLVYANGEKAELDVILACTLSMLKNNPKIVASLDKSTQYALENTSDDRIIILLKNSDFINIDVDNKECTYKIGDTFIRYPIDYRRLIMKGMQLDKAF